MFKNTNILNGYDDKGVGTKEADVHFQAVLSYLTDFSLSINGPIF